MLGLILRYPQRPFKVREKHSSVLGKFSFSGLEFIEEFFGFQSGLA